MDADEDGVAIRVCDRDSPRQWHKDIAVPGHDYAVTTGGKKGFEALRYVQCHLFFRDFLTGNTAAIKTAVTRIDYDSGGRATTLRRAASLCSRGSAACHGCNR